jgi:histidinol-phosphate aminotransferase
VAANTEKSPFRSALDQLVPYEPGRPIELVRRELGLTGDCVKLASNEGQYGPLPAARAAIDEALNDVNRYPDGGAYELRGALAEKHGVPFERVIVGNGVDAVLNYLALALLEPRDEVACCWPSFPVYKIDAVKMGAACVTAPLAGSSYDLDALLEVVGERTKMVFVTNPNNPTGGMVDGAALTRFLDALPGHVLPVVDEAYYEYCCDEPGYPDAIREHVAAGRRVVVLRTFSKIYGLAGLRVGYGVMPADVAAGCVKVKNAFDVPQVAQVAALASLDADDEIERRRLQSRTGRRRLEEGLRELGLEPLESVTNFLCVKVGDAAGLAAALEQKGVIVRPLAGFGDPTSIRVTVGLPDENEAFLAALAGVL